MAIKMIPRYHYAGVYMIKNRKNGKVYIGSSSNIERRLAGHRSALNRGIHPCEELQRDCNNHNTLETYVLYVEAIPRDSDFRDVRRRLWAKGWEYIQKYDALETGYNRAEIAKITKLAPPYFMAVSPQKSKSTNKKEGPATMARPSCSIARPPGAARFRMYPHD